MELTTLMFLIHQPDTNSWPIIFSLLSFWTPGFCIRLSDEWWPVPPRPVFYTWVGVFLFVCFLPHSNSLEHLEKSGPFILSSGRQSKVWEILLPLLTIFSAIFKMTSVWSNHWGLALKSTCINGRVTFSSLKHTIKIIVYEIILNQVYTYVNFPDG